MFWRSIGFVALALLWHLPAQLDAFVAPSTGCHHNGTWYADKSLVPTVEKCLNCQCNRKTLVCRLKVCPEMPMPPPRGCIVVQKKNTCCPYLSCARLDAFYKIPATRRIIAYLDHYERESIDRVVNDNMLQRRSDDSDVDLYVCVKNGTVYKSGSAMSSSNLCTYCYCIGGSEKCVKPKCMLPVEGCKPIFVDSTCCPVRYDCTAKASGKSSQEVRYRKTSNKHFLRMSQRLQRNRGCTVGQQFYVEGQKMKSDADRPCDICFCIRGTRRCAPKKCSPALKNCMPVVPKGQCCPSSYDCGSQRDYRRAQNSRQFNLYSLFFGKDNDVKNGTQILTQYPPDRHPSVTVTHKDNILEKNDEKSIFDTIREGLEIIDGNNEQVLAQNIDKLALQTAQLAAQAESTANGTAPSAENASTTEVSFLDLLLAEEEIASKVAEDIAPEIKETTAYEGLSWVDLLLGPDEEERKSTIPDKLEPAETTTHYQDEQTIPGIDRLGDDVSDDYSGAGEIVVGELYEAESNHTAKPQVELNTEMSSSSFANADHTTEVRFTDDAAPTWRTTLAGVKGANLPETTEKVISKVKQPTDVVAPTSTPIPKETLASTSVAPQKTTTTTTTSIPTTTTTTTARPVEQPYKKDALPLPAIAITTKNSSTTKPPEKRNDLLTALLDGISDMLSVEKNSSGTHTKSTTNTTKTVDKLAAATAKPPLKPHNLPTPRPLPSFKPLPTHKPHVRINSKIANLTVIPGVDAANSTPHNITFKPLPALVAQLPLLVTTTTPLPRTTTTTATAHTGTSKWPSSPTTTTTTTTTTVKPVVIKTNPTILESEPFESNAEPTLPPSLPNLKIIPFLPTDAVKSDKPLYDYYHSNAPAAKVDYDLYDEAHLYPSITERYASYADVEDGNKAEYIYKFNVEGPVSDPVISSTAGQLDGTTGAAAFVKYDFAGGTVPNKGFSPPTKTEGGFVPKQPLIIDDEDGAAAVIDLKLDETGYQQVTKHLIDITTGEPMRGNTTKVIEITTPDPFKDVIRTEPPPDLTSLIEDKEHILTSKHKLAPTTKTNVNGGLNQSVDLHEKDFIHITTGKPEVSTGHFSNSPSVPLPGKNRTALASSELEHKNSIEAFLDLLLRDEEQEEAVGASSSAIPPFKTLPQTAIKPAPVATSTAKIETVTASTTATPTAPSQRNATAPTTTITTTTMTTRTKTKVKHSAHRNHSNVTAAISSTATKAVAATLRPKTTKPKGSATRRAATKVTSTTSAHRRRTGSTTIITATSSERPSPSTTITATSSAITTTNPFLMSPFDKLPFMDASFEVKRSTEPPVASAAPASADNFLGLLQYKNSLNKFEGLEPAYESFLTSTSTSAPSTQRKVPQLSTSAAASAPSAGALDAQHAPTNSLVDPTGILKLAGCNIYGRMYRVGRIILELSSPCLECKCTEVGVKCGQLDC